MVVIHPVLSLVSLRRLIVKTVVEIVNAIACRTWGKWLLYNNNDL